MSPGTYVAFRRAGSSVQPFGEFRTSWIGSYFKCGFSLKSKTNAVSNGSFKKSRCMTARSQSGIVGNCAVVGASGVPTTRQSSRNERHCSIFKMSHKCTWSVRAGGGDDATHLCGGPSLSTLLPLAAQRPAFGTIGGLSVVLFDFARRIP
jgi:hypothetical protein